VVKPFQAHPLAYVMETNGWSHRDLAAVIQQEASGESVNMGAARGKVWKWMNGTNPDRVTQLLLARRLGIPSTEVDSRPWPLWLPAYSGIRTDYSQDHHGVLAAVADLGEELAMDRRGFLLLTGAGLATLAAQDVWPVEVAEPAKLGVRVDTDLLTDIASGIPRLRRIEAKLGGGGVRALVDAELRTVVGLLREGTYTTSGARRLYAVAAELARVAGWAAFDDEYHAAAQRYWSLGLYAARGAGDRLVAANILKSMSLQCLDFGKADDALDVADATQSSLRSTSPRVAAMFTLRKARALAAKGDRSGCLQLLASTDADKSDPHDADPDWIAYFDQAEYLAQVGSCYLDLGQSDHAKMWLTQALDLLPTTKARDRVTYLLRLAQCSVNVGDYGQAVTVVLQAAPLMHEARSGRNSATLNRLRGTLEHTNHRAVRDLDERLTSA
jgi:tetratricopeptide (TPR) repeat protein